MPKHALLSASASHRWLNCPPSAKLCADIKDEASPYAKQGTDAHSLCEFKVLTALGQHPPDPTDGLDYFDQEMAYCTDEYCSYVMEQLTEAKTHCKDPQVLVEQRLDFSKWIPEGFGTFKNLYLTLKRFCHFLCNNLAKVRSGITHRKQYTCH